MNKIALITGVTGQAGSYLAELFLSKGYEVHGRNRRLSLFNTERIDHLYQDPRYFRPTEVETLLDDANKAREKLGWVSKISFQEMVGGAMREDLKSAERDELVKRSGFKFCDYHE